MTKNNEAEVPDDIDRIYDHSEVVLNINDEVRVVKAYNDEPIEKKVIGIEDHDEGEISYHIGRVYEGYDPNNVLRMLKTFNAKDSSETSEAKSKAIGFAKCFHDLRFK